MAIGKNIKGITIEFMGDTTKLGKAITETDKKTRNLDNQLRAVNKSLKFNPKNTELLAQKQQLLGQKVNETKNKLAALREAQAKLDDDPAVDKTSQDYMELRREIIETESKLKHFEQQLKEMNNIKFEQLGKSVQNVGKKMKTVGDSMTKYVTAPIAAGAAGALKSFQEVDAGLDIVTQKTGATGAELAGMHDTVKTLAQEVPADFETIGTAVGEVSTRFGLTGSALEDLSEKFLQFAQINGVDVNTAIDTTQKALSAFGLSAEDAGPLLDTLNKVGQDTGASMDALLQGLVQNGTAFQELGLNAHQSAVLMGQLETSGANSETVMQGLRKALRNAAKEGIPFDQALSDLQNTILNGTDGMDGLTAAYELFGKSGDQIYGAIKNGTLDFNALGEAAADAGGSVENTFNETLDPADKFAMALSGLKVTGYEVGAVLLDTLAPAIEKFGNFVKDLAEKWKALSPETQKFILKMAGLLAVIGPVLSMLGSMTIGLGGLITILPKLIGGFSGVMGAFSKLASVLLTNPWALVAMAAIAAIVLIVKNWDRIKEFFSKLWEKVKEIFSAAWAKIKEGAVAFFEAYKQFLITYLTAWKTIITAALNAIKTVFTSVWNGIKKAITLVLTGIKVVITTYLNIWKKIISTAFLAIKKIAQLYWGYIKTVIINPIRKVKEWLSNAWTAIRDRARDGFQKIKDAIVGPIEKARDLIKGIIDKIKSFFQFDFQLPHIKLPHFEISPSGWSLGDLLEGVIPSLGIDWYAKGAIFKRPQIAGLGDVRGGEAALPLDPFWKKMDRIVEAVESGGGDDITINVYAPEGADVKQIAAEVERRLARAQKMKESVWT